MPWIFPAHDLVEARTRWAPGAAALADAARSVAGVIEGGRSTDELLRELEEAPQRAAVRAITLGCLRWYLRLAPAVDALLARPAHLPREIHSLLIASAHQIEYSRHAPEASVHAAVDATRILRQGRISGLVNAVLRRFAVERRELLREVDRSPAGRTAHPSWLVQALSEAWGDRAAGILDANNEHPPLVLRLDGSKMPMKEYLAMLAAAGIEAEAVDWMPSALWIRRPMPVQQLPGFDSGMVSVQDAGAQLAARLLDCRPGMRVLDACAAPGGKTGHILELAATPAEVIALDIDPHRLDRVEENLARLGRTAQLAVGDIRSPGPLADGRRFDRVLVDAPCSSTGVIRRHPDIKLLRRPTDIAAFSRMQEDILHAGLALLASGGRLVYCTCSLLPAENELVVTRVLEKMPAVSVAAMPPPQELPPGAEFRAPGLQLLPGAQAGSDGFYYACLEKTTTGT